MSIPTDPRSSFTLQIGPFEICFTSFPAEQDKELFKNAYDRSKATVISTLNKYLPPELLPGDSRKFAFVETTWSGIVTKKETNAKLLFRELLATKGIASQLLNFKESGNGRQDATKKEEMEKHREINALHELYCLAGLSLYEISINSLTSSTWFIGAYICEIDGKWVDY
ncbi:MAG: hypothetical protein ACFFD4_04375 [Candidatus Odinarchaeota archaeon]